jgi:carbamoyltransferase
MLSLGISCFYHDSAIALVDENEILFAAQEERYSRVKGDSGFPARALESLLDTCKISLDDITHVSYYEDPALKRNRILRTFTLNFPRNLSQIQNFIETYDTDRFFPLKKLESIFSKDVTVYKHHETHAASTFFPSPFESAAVLVMDGVGEWSTSSIFNASRNNPFLVLKEEEQFPDSLGLFYATFTAYAGFKVNSGEYKFMGLAPYGKPKYANLLRDHLISYDDNGKIKLNMEYFGYTQKLTMWNKKMESLLGFSPREAESRIRQFDCDLASSTQLVLEEVYIRKVRHALKITGETNLCLAGGVALNCVANGKLRDVLPIENIFVQPASGDAGGALGAALLRAAEEQKDKKATFFDMKHSFLGNQYSDDSIERVLKENNLVYEKLDLRELSKKCAELLASDKSLGWFSGRMEFGPRALGARSIIASATSPNMQSRLNLQIKKRESFRPFAPIVLLDKVHEWFEWPQNSDSKYMLFTAKVKDDQRTTTENPETMEENNIDLIELVNKVRSKIPAVTHVDMSARLQTISDANPMYSLLNDYYQLSSIPVLVNTSFNVRNEPIVESPWDAIRCFMTTDLDALTLGNFLLKKSSQDRSNMNEWKDNQFAGELD